MTFEDVLAGWLVKQRWFAGKGRTVHDLAVVADRTIGALRFCRIPGAELAWAVGSESGPDSLVLTGEQSNTSLV